MSREYAKVDHILGAPALLGLAGVCLVSLLAIFTSNQASVQLTVAQYCFVAAVPFLVGTVLVEVEVTESGGKAKGPVTLVDIILYAFNLIGMVATIFGYIFLFAHISSYLALTFALLGGLVMAGLGVASLTVKGS